MCCAKLNEHVILTGDVKGRIQAVNIQPNRIMETIGCHSRGVPVERLDVFDRRICLSVGLGANDIRFWNVSNVKVIEEGSKEARSKYAVTRNKAKMKSRSTFIKDLDGEERVTFYIFFQFTNFLCDMQST